MSTFEEVPRSDAFLKIIQGQDKDSFISSPGLVIWRDTGMSDIEEMNMSPEALDTVVGILFHPLHCPESLHSLPSPQALLGGVSVRDLFTTFSNMSEKKSSVAKRSSPLFSQKAVGESPYETVKRVLHRRDIIHLAPVFVVITSTLHIYITLSSSIKSFFD